MTCFEADDFVDDDEMSLSPLNLGMIAAYYNISCTSSLFGTLRVERMDLTFSSKDITVEVYTASLQEKTKLKGLLEIVSSSAEFENIPIRRHEDVLLRRIYDRVPVKLPRPNFEAPHFKTCLLLQAHFSRLQLPPDLTADQVLVLEKVLNLLSACIDVMSSNAWLNAVGAMDLSQMCVQAMWETDSPLKQIPHFDNEVIKRCKEAGVESVYDVIDLEDDQRNQLLQMNGKQM